MSSEFKFILNSDCGNINFKKISCKILINFVWFSLLTLEKLLSPVMI